jgi:hypothetical protein
MECCNIDMGAYLLVGDLINVTNCTYNHVVITNKNKHFNNYLRIFYQNFT